MKRKLLLTLLAVASGAFVALWWLLGTEQGLRFVITAVGRYTEHVCSIQEVRGQLSQQMVLVNTECRLKGARLRADEIVVAWRPRSLLWGTLAVERADVHSVELVFEGAAAPVRYEGMIVPLKLKIDRLDVDELTIIQEQKPTQFTAIHLAGVWNKERINIQEFAFNHALLQLNVSGQAGTLPASSLDLNLRWRITPQDMAPIVGQAQVTGQLQRMSVSLVNEQPQVVRATGTLAWLRTPLAWQVHIDMPPARLSDLRATWPALLLGMDMNIGGDAQTWHYQGNLTWQSPDWGRWRHTLRGQLTSTSLHVEAFELAQVGHPGLIQGRVQARFSQGMSRVEEADLRVQWRDLAWPVSGGGTKFIHSREGQLELDGTLEQYRYRLEGRVAWREIPESTWRVSGDGGRQGLRLSSLEAEALGGAWQGQGHVDWQRGVHWDLALSAEGLDPGLLWQKWSGQIAGRLQTSGAYESGRWRGTVELAKVKGQLLGRPVQGQAGLSFEDKRYTLKDLQLGVGRSKLTAGGTYDTEVKIKLQADVVDLADIVPEARGRLELQGELGGKIQAPIFKAKLNGQELVWQNLRLAQLDSTIYVDLSGVEPWSMTATLAQLSRNDNLIVRRLSLRSEGSAAAHDVHLEADGVGQEKVLLLGRGAWDGTQWRLAWQQGLIQPDDATLWRLDAGARLSLERRAAQLSQFCWRQDARYLCGEAKASSLGDWQASFDMNGMPVAALSRLLPDPWGMNGGLSGSVSIQSLSGVVNKLKADLVIDAGEITYRVAAGETLRKPLSHARFSLNKDGDGLQLQTMARLSAGEEINLSVRLPGWQPGRGWDKQQALEGRLNLELKDLTLLPVFVPDLAQPQGRIQAALTLTGTLGQPRLKGGISLHEGSALLPRLGIRLANIKMEGRVTEPALFILEGSAASGAGQVAIVCRLDYANLERIRTELEVEGRNFEILRHPVAQVLVDPKLRLTIMQKRVEMQGSLHVPQAEINLRKVQPIAQVSSDVIIVDAEVEAKPVRVWQWLGKIQLSLGDQVRLHGHGLEAYLSGNLLIEKAMSLPVTVKGELYTLKGNYKAYGQELTIEQGRLLFVGSGYMNPGLDLRVTRTKDEVTVGIIVTGRLESPELQLFSTPAMDQTDILSYLVIGRPLRQASEEEGTMLYQAATGLGMAGGELLARQIGGIFGIEEVSIEQTEDETSLVMGKQISPRFYVRYAMGVINNLNAVLLRYQLSKHWVLETSSSGAESGVDILYTIEQ